MQRTVTRSDRHITPGNLFRIVYQILDVIRNTIIVCCFIGVILLCFTDVILRYFPWLKSLGWAEEILRYTNVWIIFLGASVAVKRKAHLSMIFLLNKFRPQIRKQIEFLLFLIAVVFISIFLVYGFRQSIKNIKQQIQSFPISFAWFYFSIPVGFFYMLLDTILIYIYKKHPFVIDV